MTRRSILRLLALVSLVATTGFAPDRSNLYGSDTGAPLTPVADRQGANSNGLANPSELHRADGRGFRLREGMKFVNQVGELKEAGGRIVFYPEGYTQSLQLLENLALERVSDDLDQTQRKWSVTGIVTEYLGSNYLLLHRAVLKARVSTVSGPRS